MQICYIGDPPAQFLDSGWKNVPRQVQGMSLFEVDGAFVFGGRPLRREEYSDCQLLERSGRPVIRVGVVEVPVHRPALSNLLMVRSFEAAERVDYESWFASRPRTNYTSVACAFYDRLEAAILKKKAVQLTYLAADGDPTSRITGVKDTLTRKSEEFIQLEHGDWLRMDRILSLDGVPSGTSCNY